MWLHSWLRTLRGNINLRTANSKGGRTPYLHEAWRLRPRLEVLEDRMAPATFTVILSNDPDPINAGYLNGQSLHEAIGLANANPGADTIILPAGTYHPDAGVAGPPPPITDDVTIQGAGSGATVIDVIFGRVVPVRVFEVFGRNVTISDLTIKNCSAALVNHGGTVTLSKCDFSGNSGGNSSIHGGSFGAIVSLGGSLSLSHCNLTDNHAVGTPARSGGTITRFTESGALIGIFPFAITYAGIGQGGAIAAFSATVSLTNCNLVNNTATGGAGSQVQTYYGLGSRGQVIEIYELNVLAPADDGQGGSIYAENSTLSLTACQVTGSVARGGNGYFAGSGGSGQGGGICLINSTSTLNGCTLQNCSAVAGSPDGIGQGGSIYVDPSVVTIIASTFVGNTATVGADLFNEDSTVTIIASSIPGIYNQAGTVTDPINDVLAQVTVLNLNSGQMNSLTSKLQAAQQSLAGANSTAAVNQLNAFIAEVKALVRSHRLGEITADSLINEVDGLVELLG